MASPRAADDAVAKALKRLRQRKAGTAVTPMPTPMHVAQPAAGFQVIFSGQVERYPGVTNVYCRYAITYGVDWRVLHITDVFELQGAENGLSQIAYIASSEDEILLNFPIDVSFKSTNPLYGLDALGRDVVRGYGSLRFQFSGRLGT
ncbi:B9 domain [Phytophthora cactorum]|nr:B9 domain [Phytophthora cactorum]